jgi:hypothetical protein
MKLHHRFSLSALASLSFLLLGVSSAAAQSDCLASDSWVSNPNPPQEIPNQGETFCDFYQFSWQWFLDLTSPSADESGLRNFQVAADYPVLQASADGNPVDSCTDDADGSALFVRTMKAGEPGGGLHIPERIHQAGDAATIYDQDGVVVFYNIRFSRNLCDIGAIQAKKNFPAGTTEMKTAWRVIDQDQRDDYFWMEADIEGIGTSIPLGLVGFHLVRNTELHPEFVWITFEHKSNAPDCTHPQSEPSGGWSFTSSHCADELSDGSLPPDCHFNTAKKVDSLTGTPTEICRVYRDGTDPSDHKAQENVQAIDQLNQQLVGPDGFLTALSDDDPMKVWSNYFMVGALWVSDISQPSSIENQRGSLRLANTVMETTFQDVDISSQFVSNCFGCHGYQADQSNTLPSSSLSHSFDAIMRGLCTQPADVEAGPIWSNDDAQDKCPQVCSSHGGWNGQWTTTEPGTMSVCGCCQSP